MASLSCIPKFVKDEIVTAWKNETLKLMLLSVAHIPDAATQQFVADVVANEITDTGPAPKYTAGGVSIGVPVSTADGNNYFLDAPDKVIGPGATISYRRGVLFADTGNQATSKIRAHIDFEIEQSVTNGTSTIQWNALGIIYVS